MDTVTPRRRRRFRILGLAFALALLGLGLWLMAYGMNQTADVLSCQWERTDPFSTATTTPDCAP